MWLCVVLRLLAGMSLPEGKLERGIFFFPKMSVRGDWYEAGARSPTASGPVIWSGLWGVSQVCVWAMIPQRDEQDAERKSRWHLPSYHHIIYPPPPPAADSHRPALSKFGFYSVQRRTRYPSLVPLKAAIVSSCEEADLPLNRHQIIC